MFNLVIFGPPGAGKGTQAKVIAEKLNLVHLSSGEILRQELIDGEFGPSIQKCQAAGILVPNEILIPLMEREITKNLDKAGLIFDGFPRTIVQAELLEQILAKHQTSIARIINLQLNQEEAVKRILQRGLESGRSDDNPETIKDRFVTYEEKTLPLLNYYRAKGNLIDIDGFPPIPEVSEKIMEALDDLFNK